MRSTRFALIAALPILCLVPPVAWAADYEPEQEKLFFHLEYLLGVGFHSQEDVEGAGATGAGRAVPSDSRPSSTPTSS